MNILGLGLSNDLAESLGPKLIMRGHTVFSAHDTKHAEKLFKEQNISVVVTDSDYIGFDVLEFLKSLRTIFAEQNFKIILISQNTSSEFIKDLICLDLAGFIVSHLPNEERIKKILNTVDKLFIHFPEQRNFTRVAPAQDEVVNISIASSNKGYFIEGVLLNISLGGMAFKLNTSEDLEYLKINQMIKDIQINLGSSIILADGIVVFIRNDMIGIKFLNIREPFLQYLSKYIFERLTEV